MIRQVFYISRATAGLDEGAVQAILAVSRKNNWRADITGILMSAGSHFAQVLEGRHDDIEALLARVRADRRHEQIHMLLDRPASRREYGDWSMGHFYKSAIADELVALSTATERSEESILHFFDFLRADTVMGTL